MPLKTNRLARYVCLAIFSLWSCSLLAQKTVTGKVTNNADKQPLAGATIQIKGTKTVTASDADGTFRITVPQNNSVLQISVVGFDKIEIPVGAKTDLGEIALTTSATNLNEVFVTGYTSQRKKDITGAVSVVNVTELKQTPSGSTEALLQGQASGVTVFSTGQPGGASVVQIRGITSAGTTTPLVIIDGVPGNMHDLNVNDIQSIQVLKDAGAAAIYGVRGSNGVIIITTKKGLGALKLSYDAYVGTQVPLKDGWKLASPTQTGEAKWAQAFNDGQAPSDPQYGSGPTPVVPYYITPTGAAQGAPNTSLADYDLYNNHITIAAQNGNNWFNDIFRPALIMNHNISASGGNGKSSYFFSFNYFDQDGTLIETSLKRYSVRFNSTFSLLDDHIRIGENAFALYKTNPGYFNAPGVNSTNSINTAYQLPNIIPIHDIAGNYAGGISNGLGNASNPVAIQERQADDVNQNYQISGNVFADVDFLKHFTIHTSLGGLIDHTYKNGFATTPYENAENNHAANLYLETYGLSTSMIWTNTLRYANKIGKHDFSILAGTEYIYGMGRGSLTTRGNYYITDSSNLTVSPNLRTLNFGQASTQTNNSTIILDNDYATPYQQALFSLFARVDYSYDGKYLLSGTIRRDGSSAFAADQRYGNFPSVTAGWRISEESFMKSINWLNELKIRGGWGKLGTINNINPTNAYSLYGQQINQSYYDLNGTSNTPVAGLYVSQYGNPNTSWEKDVLTNIGFDATILNNRLDFSFEWYKKLISGLLTRPSAPGTNGGALDPFINSGNIQNTGIDMSLTYHGIVSKDLRFDITGTFTSYKNKVVSLPPGTLYFDETGGGQTVVSRLQPGHPIGAFFGYQVIGLFDSWTDVNKSPTQEAAAPGRFKYADVNGDHVIDNNDRTFFGNPNPKFTAGLNITVNYKNFDFYSFFYASVGNDILNGVKSSTDFPQGFNNQISENVAVNSARLINDAGQPTNFNDPTAHIANPGTKVPMLELSNNFSNSQAFNSYTMESGSFLRCRNITIGYNVVSNAIKRLHFDKIRIYVQALNLFTITKYSGLDPELNPGGQTVFGIDGGVYPNNQKTYSVGVNVTIH